MARTNRPPHGKHSRLAGLLVLLTLAGLLWTLDHVATAPSMGHGDCIVCIAMHSATVHTTTAAVIGLVVLATLHAGHLPRVTHRVCILRRGRAPPLALFA